MRLGIHMATSRGSGSSQVGLAFLDALQRRKDAHRYIVWVPDTWPVHPPSPGNIEIRSLKSSTIQKFWMENVWIRWDTCQFALDGLLSLTDTSVPFVSIPHVLFVQQAFLAYSRSEMDFCLPRRIRAKFSLMAMYFRLGLASVDRLVVQTTHMKNHLCARWKVSPDIVDVIPSAVALSVGETEQIDMPKQSIAVIGSAAPHKNLDILPEVIRLLATKHPDIRCFLTVRAPDVPGLCQKARANKTIGHFEFLGPISHEKALALMQSARVSLLPSKLESFGLPYWEGLGMGAPMVVSDREFAREICGSAAMYADPDDPAAWAKAIGELFDNDRLETHLRHEAKKRFEATALSVDTVVDRFIQLVENVVAEKNDEQKSKARRPT